MANYEILLPENVEQTTNGVQLLISLPSQSDDCLPKFDPLIFCLHIKGILDLAFHTVDNVLLGSTPPHQGPETQDFESYSDNSSDLLCKLQQISSELAACKLAPGGGNELKTTISILNKLSSYTWAGKAVLVIAAFALDYGDFWGLAQLHSLEKLAESVGITHRVLAMSKRPDLKKCQKVIEVRKLIENTMEVITSIAELEVNYSKWAENFGNILSMTAIAKCIPVHVFWAVVTVVASTTQMYCLSSDEDKTLELSPLSQKMNSAWNILKTQIEECDQQIEEVNAYSETRELPETPTKIVEAFKALFFAEESSELLIDGSSKILLRVDALKNKNFLLFISDITDISVKEISILKPIFDGIKDRDEQYKIVWIPIAEHWTDDVQAKFQMLQSNMPWYILKRFPAIVDMQIVRNEYCSLKNKPIVVVINPKWEVEHPNALRMIRLWGMKAFPFTVLAEQALIPIGLHYQTRAPMLAPESGPTSPDDSEEYSFNYRFVDVSSKKRFDTLLKKIRSYITSKSLKITIIEKKGTSAGWVELYNIKGTSCMIVGDTATKILEVLEKYEDWMKSVEAGRRFDESFKSHYDSL